MRVLITGSSGFIGGAIATSLSRCEMEIVGLDSCPQADFAYSAHFTLNIASDDFIHQALHSISPCEVIIHAAASKDMDFFQPLVIKSNCLGTQQLLKLASVWKTKKFIFLSSLPVVGKPRQLPITEQHSTSPETVYHASKLFGEYLVQIAESNRMMSVSLRLTAPVGHGMPAERLLPIIVKQARKNAPITLYGQGGRIQNYVDVRDISQAVHLCLHKEVGGIFNIGSHESISNLNLARLCVKTLSSSSPIQFSDHPDKEENIAWEVSIEKARRQLGYSPLYTLEDTIKILGSDYENSNHK